MLKRFMTSITTGAIIGAAAGMAIYPTLDRSTKRKVRRSSRRFMHTAGDLYNNMMHMMK